mgnify:FL=1
MTLKSLTKQIESLENKRVSILQNERNGLLARIKEIDAVLGRNNHRKSATVPAKTTRKSAPRAKRGSVKTAILSVLQTAGRPIHYSEVADAVSKSKVDFGKAGVPTADAVHNSLYQMSHKGAIVNAGEGRFAFKS